MSLEELGVSSHIFWLNDITFFDNFKSGFRQVPRSIVIFIPLVKILST